MLVFVKLFGCLVLFTFSLVFCDEDPEEPLTSARIIRPRCRADKDCNPNAFCFGNDNYVTGHCKCSEGFEMFSEGRTYECLEELQLGQNCLKNIQCQVSAGALAICAGEDNDKYCKCNETLSHQVKNRCYETKYLDDFCQVDENCLLPESPAGEDKFAICASTCSCPIGMKPSLNKKRCLGYRRLGHTCENDFQCQLFTDNSVCRQTCTCEAGYVRSSYLQTCLKAALRFDDPCIEDAQCSAHLEEAVCVKNRCTCPKNFHGYLVRCRADAMPGNVCFDIGDCLISKVLKDKVECRKGVCNYIYGKSYDDDICLSGGSSMFLGDLKMSVFCVLAVLVRKFFIY